MWYIGLCVVYMFVVYEPVCGVQFCVWCLGLCVVCTCLFMVYEPVYGVQVCVMYRSVYGVWAYM